MQLKDLPKFGLMMLFVCQIAYLYCVILSSIYLGFISQLEFFCFIHTMDDTASTHVSCSSLTIEHTKDKMKATAGKCMGCPTETKHEDDIG
jgi:hypothetical protein